MRPADDDQLDDAEREIVRKLRALPGEGQEPDWGALERAIHDAVGPDMPRRAWWRWLIPAFGIAAVAAAALLLWLHRDPASAPVAPTPSVAHDEPAPRAPEPAMAIWIDGRVLDLEDVDPSAITDDEVDDDARDALATDDGSGIANGVLPAGDLGWVDRLDDRALDEAEQWLERKKT